ncbi:DUF6474 family protein [Corynebacterium sanguinis]|uniref:DUF6474 family protein n=1 Tax=Corynebacterium sanguinis TaxID=2594913 RepID=UPI001186EFFE|nr:DUF6474 family protein [Corynebacterium sanguinis]MCT1412466.1 DUF6474 family protein [Corynebacterium sanguinis]MCT1426405.1 DUF6474 family protein [Corynebacterium sanguinis]MCT1493264.1 DUF6474 family protein [Corynebacterium sanguinis]MCT1629097.1 DUF6474 family protein [Corynebacterium sanguinis]MCT2024064.1 DUF6474 family protein [Corynebacterium sanguinis]
MGIIETIRKNRAKTKAEIKAAEVRARQLAMNEAKQEHRTAKLLDKAEKRLLTEEKKGLKRKRKHEKKLAEAHLKRVEESGLTKKKAKNWVGAARVLIPVLLPLAYKAMTSYQQNRIESRANSMGLSSQDLARHSGRGAELKARIEALRGQTNNLHNTPSLSSSFIKDVEVRLDELEQAVSNAERLDTEQQRLAHVAIERDLDEVTGEIQKKSGR